MLRLGVSLRTRLTLWYGALLALTLLAFSALLYFTLQQSLASSMDERLTLRADQLRREVGPSIGNLLQPEDVAPGQLESTLGEFAEPGIYVQLVNQRGAVVAAPPNLVGGVLPVPRDSLQAIDEDRPIFVTLPVASGDASVRLLTEPIHMTGTGEVVGAVQVAESLSPFENTMAAVSRLLLSAGLLALLLAVVIGWLVTRAAISPVFRITETARHIAETGDYRRRLHVTRPRFGHGDELFFLAATFNDMIARLEHMLESQRRLLGEKLGIDHVMAVVGPSMGGMQALQWGVSHPDFMDSLVALVPLARTPAWSAVIVEATRKAIMLDPAWNNGNYTSIPVNGVRIWRDIFFAVARTPEMYRDQFANPLDVLPWLKTQEDAVLSVFDPNDYIYQSWAYESHDVGATPGMSRDYAKALRAIKAKTLIMTGVKDLLNPEWEPLEAARHIRDVRTVTISPESVTGHFAAGGFRSADVEQINAEVAKFLDVVTRGSERLR